MVPDLTFVLCMKTATLAPEITSLYGFQPSSVFFHAKQRLYDQTYKTVWGPDLIYGFCMKTSNFWTEIACLYGS